MKYENNVIDIIGEHLAADDFTVKKPFSTEIMNFINLLSSEILKDTSSRNFPDVVSFAFWCRKSNLIRVQSNTSNAVERLGRGVAFHIAPSNVPVNFAYSLIVGLLSGNRNIVRLPSKTSEQIDIICRCIKKILDELNDLTIQNLIHLIRFEKSDDTVSFFSKLADVRVIWGGDRTIQNVRGIPSKPKCVDLCFADRYSICLLSAKEFENIDDANLWRLASNFYNDTFTFDQGACSTPHLIIWIGGDEEASYAQGKFWTQVGKIVDEKYEFQKIHATERLMHACRLSIELNADKRLIPADKTSVSRMHLRNINDDLSRFRGRYGFFVETNCRNLNILKDLVNTKYQTLTYFGLEPIELRNYVFREGLSGIDRIVPVGEALAFDIKWDGQNLVETMSRIIVTT